MTASSQQLSFSLTGLSSDSYYVYYITVAAVNSVGEGIPTSVDQRTDVENELNTFSL